MPITYQILADVRAIVVECQGAVTLEEILQYEGDVVADPRFDATFAEVFDLRGAGTLDLSFEEVERVVDLEKNHKRYAGNRKTAFVAPTDLEFGVTRMYQMMEEDSPMVTRVFRSAEAACSRTCGSPIGRSPAT